MSDDKFRLSCGCEVRQSVGFLYVCPAHKELIAREREACAQVADEWGKRADWMNEEKTAFVPGADRSERFAATGIAERIRARSNDSN
jgi:hypothetical protein